MTLIPEIRLGTSAFTAAGWPGKFYPAGMQPRDYLSYYATKFDTVEVDSTYYRIPPASTVSGWAAKTPDGFLFSLKIPQVITHEKILVNCQAEFEQFLEVASLLETKLGVLVFQFPYFNKSVFRSGSEFIERLRVFIKKLPHNIKFAVEIRNKAWLDERFADVLRERDVALVLQDQSWMPRPTELFKKFDPITANFTYVRWLGDRKGIEERTEIWDKTIVDRTVEISEWVEILRRVVNRGIKAFAYANNHYAGYAPDTIALFHESWNKHL